MYSPHPAGLTACVLTSILLACGDPAGLPSRPTGGGDDPIDRGESPASPADAEGSPSTGGAGQSTGEPGVCETLDAYARPNQPRVLIVVDRSGSMAGERWNQVTRGVASIVREFPAFSFGLSLYPAIGEELDCSPGKLDVAPQEGNGEAVTSLLLSPQAVALQDQGYTPTAVTLEAAREALSLQPDDEQPRYVLLVTDGNPNCRIGFIKPEPDEEATFAAVDGLRDDGINTFVIGYDTELFAPTMDEMARRGGTERHYAVENQAELESAIDEIAAGVVPCSYQLETPPPSVEFVRVQVDGQDVPLGPDGFSLRGDRTIELGGSACEGLRDGDEHGVKVLVECEPVQVL